MALLVTSRRQGPYMSTVDAGSMLTRNRDEVTETCRGRGVLGSSTPGQLHISTRIRCHLLHSCGLAVDSSSGVLPLTSWSLNFTTTFLSSSLLRVTHSTALSSATTLRLLPLLFSSSSVPLRRSSVTTTELVRSILTFLEPILTLLWKMISSITCLRDARYKGSQPISGRYQQRLNLLSLSTAHEEAHIG